MTNIKKIAIVASALGLFLAATPAFAATLSVVPQGTSFSAGQQIQVDIILDTEGVNINAAQADITFPQGVLQFVDSNRGQSAFNFWVEDPNALNGVLSFIGGTPQGISGKSLNVFTARFKAIGTGSANFGISSGVVAANDGKGTNVLSAVKGATITIGGTAVSGSATPPPAGAPTPTGQPQVINRPAVAASGLPKAPDLKVGICPDPSKWCNQIGNATAFWTIPADVNSVAASIDHSPKNTPPTPEKDLVTGKDFGILKEGVWYIHAQFHNSVGWGPVTNYRVAIDNTKPADFTVSSAGGVKSDDPHPTLNFSTTDSLSGIAYYLIQINNQEPLKATSSPLTLAPLLPGPKNIIVTAVDNAGNQRNASTDIEIVPVESPVISFVSPNVLAGEGGLIARGSAVPGYIVKLAVRSQSDGVAAEAVVTADEKGNWTTVFGQPLNTGKYFIQAVAQDSRSASSLPVNSALFSVTVPPLLTIGGINITRAWFAVILLLLVLGAAAFGWFSNRLWKKKVSRKTVIAQRDAVAFLNGLNKDLEKILTAYSDKVVTPSEAVEIETGIRKVKDKIEKIGKFVTKGISEISD